VVPEYRFERHRDIAAMNHERQVSRLLDDEHRANLELLGRVEKALAAGRDAEVAALAGALARQLESEVGRHFDFEERELFPRMTDAGDGDLAELLTEEHAVLREVAAELVPLARAVAAGTASAADAATLRIVGLEFVERQVAHIQKETMALLPMLDDLLDDETDRALAFEYAVHA
jgi:hemerythrin-like domain-containing protein